MAKKMWVPARTAIVCNGGDCFRQRCAFFVGGRSKREPHWGNEYSKNMGSAVDLLRSPCVYEAMPVALLLAHESGHLLAERTAAGFLTDDDGVDGHHVGGVD